VTLVTVLDADFGAKMRIDIWIQAHSCKFILPPPTEKNAMLTLILRSQTV
jgi:hypothetical protein